ncbi:cyclic nucleotide-binding protein [Vogesella sp. LIG4]|uniref:CBU_0592 family membrane protein n=1 Tax=Vogesella sp. LIG4 TaxID=1192162 RepID=UPI0008200561|nr:cyclic nucleotide-binding protein [Vogesella sp. LIG4]SCK29605.1 hypothetical protein PSELUDRAFT_3650 [Vogesella sp. LIG4]
MESHVIVGLLGTICYITAYALVQLRKLSFETKSYAYLNIIGGIFSLYSLSHDFNLAAFITQAFWLTFTMIGMKAKRQAA